MRSIGTTLAFRIALVLALAMSLFGAFQIYQQQRRYEQFLRDKEEHTLKPLALILGRLVFEVDEERLETVMRSYLSASDILSIKVIAEGMIPLYLGKDPETSRIITLQEEEHTSFESPDSVHYQKSLMALDREVGTFDIIFSRKFLTDQTRQLTIVTSVNIALAIVIGSVAIVVMVRKHITTPLLKLANATQRIAAGDVSELFVNTSSKGEIRQVLASLKDMTTKIGAVIHEINKLTQAIQEGRLDFRGDAERFSGNWRELVVGVNNVIDKFVAPINVTAEYIARIARGDLPEPIRTEYRGDFNAIKQNLNTLIQATHDVTTIAQEIAGGNVEINVFPRSEQDELMQTLEQMVSYLRNVAGVAEQISNQELQVAVTPRSEKDILNRSLQQMISNLQAMLQEVQERNWLMAGQAELSNAMRGEQALAILSKQIITFLAKYLEAQIGTLYIARAQQGESSFKLTASYAFKDRQGIHNEFKPGEWLVGQAALEQESLLYKDLPEEYLTIGSSLGNISPRQILVTPMIYANDVKGVVELGTLHEFTDLQRNFLENVQENIAIAINSAQTRLKMQELLEATQQQAEELQAQQELLRTTNAELESQTKTLQESEQQLRIQQEELRQTNEALESQTKALGQQRKELQDKNAALQAAQQLIEAKAKALEITSKYKSEFLANMSHELRTPLNSLLILAKLLSENKHANLTDKQLESINMIHAAGSDLLLLINDVLDLSKIEAGQMTLNIDEMNLRDFTRPLTQMFQHVIEGKGLFLNVAIAENTPSSIRSDRQRVEQILKNFFSNAIKFTKTGGITFHINRPDPGTTFFRKGLELHNTLAFGVTDTGIGIPQEKQQLIFEAFQQADGSTSRTYGGTGLGLSISRELARLLGGELRLHSEPGKGSTFTLYLPESGSPALRGGKKDGSPALRGGKKDGSPALRGGKKDSSSVLRGGEKGDTTLRSGEDHPLPPIPQQLEPETFEVSSTERLMLIIEDDSKFAKVLSDLAGEHGFTGLIASDGVTGLKFACQYKPLAILLDIGLPDMDGLHVMERLKANPETRYIPVQFISAYDRSLEAMKMGAIGYLSKPVTPEAVEEAFEMIEKTLTRAIKHVLVIEDNPVSQASIVRLLDGEDVRITTTATGEEAYRLLQTEAFDCLVLDLGLPDISGFEFLERINHENLIAQLPIIIYTARELTQAEEAALKRYSESIIIKGVRSQDRLLDEVTLFLHRVESDLSDMQRKTLRTLYDKETALTDKTVLVVDDDVRNIYALSEVLEEKGMTVVMAGNGKKALEKLDQRPDLDLVLMDIMMPEMDGCEALREIRKQPRFKNLPVIALTAKAMQGDRQQCIEAGANDYMAKPVDIDKLLSLLQVWLY